MVIVVMVQVEMVAAAVILAGLDLHAQAVHLGTMEQVVQLVAVLLVPPMWGNLGDLPKMLNNSLTDGG